MYVVNAKQITVEQSGVDDDARAAEPYPQLLVLRQAT
jgi:hypothetical protein